MMKYSKITYGVAPPLHVSAVKSWLETSEVNLVIAANESEFWPSICLNTEFADWMIRTSRRLSMTAGAGDKAIHRAICWEGVPPPDWVTGIEFAISLRLLKTAKPKIFAVG
jgi:hypothetical protein